MNPIVSVIIPVYNSSSFLRKCIDSAIQQTFENYEIILVDDGSTDNSGQICDDYADANNRVIVVHQENGGVSSARNKGIARARGKYLTFLDSDDWVAPNWLEVLYNGFADDVGLVGCNLIYQIDNTTSVKAIDTETRSYWEINGTETILRFLFKHPETMTEKFHHGSIGRAFVWNKMYRMDVVQKNHVRFNESIKVGEDYDFNYHYMSHISEAKFTLSATYYYQNNGSAMAFSRSKRTYNEKMINYTILFDDIYEAERKIHPEIGKCCEAIAIRLYNRCLAGMVKANKVDRTFADRAIRFNRKHFLCNRLYDADSSASHLLSSMLLALNFRLWKIIVMKFW